MAEPFVIGDVVVLKKAKRSHKYIVINRTTKGRGFYYGVVRAATPGRPEQGGVVHIYPGRFLKKWEGK